MTRPSELLNKQLDEILNCFIEKWLPESYAHLIDTDDNDGERLRAAIKSLIANEVVKARIEGIEFANSEVTKHRAIFMTKDNVSPFGDDPMLEKAVKIRDALRHEISIDLEFHIKQLEAKLKSIGGDDG